MGITARNILGLVTGMIGLAATLPARRPITGRPATGARADRLPRWPRRSMRGPIARMRGRGGVTRFSAPTGQ